MYNVGYKALSPVKRGGGGQIQKKFAQGKIKKKKKMSCTACGGKKLMRAETPFPHNVSNGPSLLPGYRPICIRRKATVQSALLFFVYYFVIADQIFYI